MMNRLSKVKIYYTDDYSIFKAQEGNRKVNISTVKILEKKILDCNLLSYHPILVDSDYFVIDGQHRLSVARSNNLIIHYIIMSDKAGLSITQKINTTGKQWTTRDFLESYCSTDNINYLEFNNLLKRYKFLTLSQLLVILSNQNTKKSLDDFKDGLLIVNKSNISRSCKILNRLAKYDILGYELRKISHFQRYLSSSVDRGIIFDDVRLISRIKKNMDTVKNMPHNKCVIGDILNDIYNFNLRKNNINLSIRRIN